MDIVLQTDVKSQVSKIANGTTDAQNFLDATSTTVVKNKASNTDDARSNGGTTRSVVQKTAVFTPFEVGFLVCPDENSGSS